MLVACRSCHLQYNVEGMKAGEHVRCRCGELVEVPRQRRRQARVLHCSACGGKLRDQARSCDYCGGEITARERNLGPACPECFARLPLQARFCSECGVEIRPDAIRTTRSSARCPRCRKDLVLRELEKGHYTECTSCAGIWLDDKSFERVIDEKSTQALGKLMPGERNPSAPPSSAGQVQYLPCPVCGQLMHRKNFGGSSGIIIDWCKGHGFWFDAEELDKVVAFVNSGGLEHARKLEIEGARAELARLEMQKKGTAQGWRGSMHNPGSDWFSSLGHVFRAMNNLFH